MTGYQRREVVTTTVESVLRSPCPIGEVYRALNAIRLEVGEENASNDDHAWFECRDDELVIRFEKSKAVAR